VITSNANWALHSASPSCITSLVSFSRSHVSRIVKTVTITVSLSY